MEIGSLAEELEDELPAIGLITLYENPLVDDPASVDEAECIARHTAPLDAQVVNSRDKVEYVHTCALSTAQLHPELSIRSRGGTFRDQFNT